LSGPVILPEGFGPAAEKLADTVRHVVDIAVGPDRIRARAQAQADSALILAEGRAQVQDIEARAVERLRKRETRRQCNIESITVKALDALPPPEQISSNPVSEDWTSRFFEECQDINDEEMQQIWARILAGEIARPGSFGRRTLSIVRDLEKEDTHLFAKICDFVWHVPPTSPIPVIPNFNAAFVTAAGITFSTLTHLKSIGLIELDYGREYSLDVNLKAITPSYFGQSVSLRTQGGQERKLILGHVLFSGAGVELHRIVHGQPNQDHRNLALDMWIRDGWIEDRDEARSRGEELHQVRGLIGGLISRQGGPNGTLRIRYSRGPDDSRPFILTLTPQYVAQALEKTLPITVREIHEYANRNADHLKAIAQNAKDQGLNAQVL
jgi:hypothetical protein